MPSLLTVFRRYHSASRNLHPHNLFSLHENEKDFWSSWSWRICAKRPPTCENHWHLTLTTVLRVWVPGTKPQTVRDCISFSFWTIWSCFCSIISLFSWISAWPRRLAAKTVVEFFWAICFAKVSSCVLSARSAFSNCSSRFFLLIRNSYPCQQCRGEMRWRWDEMTMRRDQKKVRWNENMMYWWVSEMRWGEKRGASEMPDIWDDEKRKWQVR